jgi:translin
VREHLEAKHRAREQALALSREVIRLSANAIRSVHRREFDPARELLAKARANLAETEAALVDHSDILHAGYVHDAQKEFAEANLTLAFVSEQAMPAADELRVEVQAYLNGMAEAASELRRQVLDCLRRDERREVERMLVLMDEVYGILITIDYPDALTGGLRRTTDALRAVLERTRGDVTTAIVAARLQRAIEDRT